MSKILGRFKNDDSGATAIEYGLIAALISIAIVAGASALGTNIGTTFTNLATCVATPNAEKC